jgi:hypothetical protein
VGSTNHHAQSKPMYWGYRENGGGSCPLSQPIADAGTKVVGPPDHLRVVVDTNGPLQACPTVVGRKITFQVVDNLENPETYVPVQENFVYQTTNTCGNGQPIPSSCAPTDSGGRFTDNITINCGGANGPPHCGYNLTDHWEWCPSGKPATNVGTLYDVTDIDAITVNSVTTPNKMPPPPDIYPQ